MILTVTLNAALDVTYHVPAMVEGASHRVEAVTSRAGGKGVNVARVLHGFGHEVMATGLAGGASGRDLREDLEAAGVPAHFTEVNGSSRRTVTVVSGATGDATVFNEPGPAVAAAEWRQFLSDFEAFAAAARLVVCSGSMPPGVPVDAYAQLCQVAIDQGTGVFIDAAGPPLSAALAEGPLLVKPNRHELVASAGVDDPLSGARLLREAGATSVVASLGPEGLLAVTPDGAWRARPGSALSGNPTGAGDACVAALAAGQVEALGWPERLTRAVAWSAAAVLSPTAGEVEPFTAARQQADVTIEEIHAPDTDG